MKRCSSSSTAKRRNFGPSPVSPWQCRYAASLLRAGAVIAYPTEAVWGLGCDPFNADAVEKLLEIKQRSWTKGLILIAAEIEQFEPLLGALNQDQLQSLKQSWPGFQTWILPDPANRIPAWIKGRHSGVACRVSAHPTVQRLCRGFGGAIVSTSANLSGHKASASRFQVMRSLGPRVDYLTPGKTGGEARPSPIRDLVSGELKRSL